MCECKEVDDGEEMREQWEEVEALRLRVAAVDVVELVVDMVAEAATVLEVVVDMVEETWVMEVVTVVETVEESEVLEVAAVAVVMEVDMVDVHERIIRN